MKPIHLISILAAAAIAAAGPVYNIADLGSLGGSDASAFGLNSSGLAVGAAITPAGYMHAFSAGAGSPLTDLALNTNASEGQASAVNSAGQIVGTQFVGGQAFATSWSNGTAATIGNAGSYATSINDAGQIAGMLTTSGGHGNAFVESKGSTVDLGTPLGDTWSSAYGINNSGEVVGYGMSSGGAFGAFTWTSSGGFQPIGTLGGRNSYAMAVNNAGQVAGSAQLADGYLNAFLFSGGALMDLGTLGGSGSGAYAINAAGEVVGYSYVDGASVPHAFLYENGVMLDLNNLIDPASGWVLTQAYAINASGAIAGAGLFDGVEQAFLLQPAPAGDGNGLVTTASPSSVPEPATWSVVLTGLAACAAFGFRSRRSLAIQRAKSRAESRP